MSEWLSLHFIYVRKRKGIKGPLDEGEKGSWKKWLFKTQHSKNEDHGIGSHHFMANGRQWKQWKTLFLGAPKSLQMVTAAMKLKDDCSLEEKLWQIHRQHIKKQRHYFADKGSSSQSYGFSSSHVGCASWTIKNAGIEEPMVLNCSVGEDSWESLGLQGDTISPS